jgi:hypothetical protein
MGLEALLSSQIIGLSEAIDDRTASLLVAGTGIALTYDDGAGTLTIANTGLGGSTGSTDNRILRSDGTGGATVQASAVTIDDSGNISGIGTVSASGIISTSATRVDVFESNHGLWVSGGILLRFGGSGVLVHNGSGLMVRPTDFIGFSSTSTLSSPSVDVAMYRNSTGPSAEIRAAGGLIVNNAAGSANAALACGAITASGKISASGNGGDVIRWIRPGLCDFGLGDANGDSVRLYNNGAATDLLRIHGTTRIITAYGALNVGTYTVATLPSAAANAGALAQVTDSSVTTNGSTVAGSGSNRVPVFSDGTTWIVK